MGKKITDLNTLRGCCAETGAIAGVGMSQSFRGTQWSMMRIIFLTWVLTIPVTALIAAIIMLIHQ
jgi:PiT family inorganic phosphate transporter